MNWQFLTWIWRPDTYFMNGQDSYLHKVAVPNRFIRVAPNGRVSYSQRLTVTAKCKMNLRLFPHDSQSCPLKVASFGHSLTDVVYRWTEKPATLGDIELSQYHFISLNHGHENSSVRDETRSVVFLTFSFDRAIGFYVLQVYIPLTIIVMSSWVSFWLVRSFCCCLIARREETFPSSDQDRAGTGDSSQDGAWLYNSPCSGHHRVWICRRIQTKHQWWTNITFIM